MRALYSPKYGSFYLSSDEDKALMLRVSPKGNKNNWDFY